MTVSAHVLVNLAFARWARTRLARVELVGAATGLALVLAGLLSAEVLD